MHRLILIFILVAFSAFSSAAIVPDKCLYLSWSEVTTNTDDIAIVVDRYSVHVTFQGIETTYDILHPETSYMNCAIEEGTYAAQVSAWEAGREGKKSVTITVTASIEIIPEVEPAPPTRVEITGNNLKFRVIDNPETME